MYSSIYLYKYIFQYEQLFASGEIPRPAALEDLLKKTCPDLSKQIVCIADRIIYRQAPQHAPFLL
jgi:hypothetical protein